MGRRLAAVLTLLLLEAAACSSNSKPPCGSRDAAVVEVGFEIPPGCPPAQANELGIGKPCGMCGNECTGNLHCTCDPYLGVQLSGVPCVCTLLALAPQNSTNPCGAPLDPNFCGSGTTCCSYLTTAAYCVPDVCLPGGQCVVFVPVDAGTD